MQYTFKSLFSKIFPIILLGGYIFLPSFLGQFVCLCFLLCLLFNWEIRQDYWLLPAVAAVYSLAFIVTPFSCYLFTSPEKLSPLAVAMTNFAIASAGVVWLYAVGRNRHMCLETRCHRYFFSLYLLLFLVVFLPSWKADLPYGGDELYHIMSAQVFRIFLADAATLPILAAYILLAAAAIFFLSRGKEKSLLPIASAGLLLAALWAQFAYVQNTELLESLWARERIVRYPMAQTWLSCFLANCCRRYWDSSWFSNEILRFLPVLSLFSLGLFLGGDKKWRQAPTSFITLAAIFIVTIPDFFYHATILYLELPCLLLMTVVLLDKEILTGHGRAWKKSSWWALVLLGFTKETAIPVILIILGWRMIFQVRLWKKGEQGFADLAKQEFKVWFCALFPALLYFAMRYKILSRYPGMYHRSYGAHFGNVLDLSLWVKGFFPLWYQFGAVLPLACYGVWRLVKNGAWKTVLLCISLLIALKGFFICDSSEWVDLPRFNLILLPPIVVLAWEGLSELLEKSRSITGGILILLIAANLLMSPVNLRGERTWKDSGDLWYPYARCFDDIRHTAPVSHILLGNMQYRYGAQIVSAQLKWHPYIRQHPLKFRETTVQETLQFARERGFDIVIYRTQGKISSNYTRYGFIKMGEYHARFGSLIVFCNRPLAFRILRSGYRIGDKTGRE